MNAIEIRNASKSYPGFQLGPVTMDLSSGAILGLVGENGAGKTTLIKMLLGIKKQDSGTLRVLGSLNLRDTPKRKEDIGVVLDEVCLPDFMKTPEIGKMLGKIYWNWDQDVFDGFVERMHIPTDKKFKNFSKGNKMKLGIACAMSHHPKLLILDEATSGLDPVVRDDLLDLLMDFTREEDHAILMSSHIVSDLEKACDYIAFLHEGKLLLKEEKDVLLEEYGKLSCSLDEFAAIDPSSVVGKRQTPYGVEAIVRRDEVPGSLHFQPIRLEELFVMMVKGDKG